MSILQTTHELEETPLYLIRTTTPAETSPELARHGPAIELTNQEVSVEVAPALTNEQVSEEVALETEPPSEEQLAAREAMELWLEFLEIRASPRIDPVYAGITGVYAALMYADWYASMQRYIDTGRGAMDGAQGTVTAVVSVSLLTIGLFRHSRNSRLAERDEIAAAELSGASIGPLAGALMSHHGRVRSAAARMMARAIPSVTASDFAMVTEGERERLYQYLRGFRTGNSELGVAIIHMLKRVGGDDAIETLDAISNGRGWRRLGIQRQAASAIAAIRSRDSVTKSEPNHTMQPMKQFDNTGLSENAATAQEIMTRIRELEQQLQSLDGSDTQSESQSVVDPLISRVEQELEKSAGPSLRVGIMYAGWAVTIPFTLFGITQSVVAQEPLAAVAYAALLAAALMLPRWALSRRLLIAAAALAGCNDKRTVGKLVEMLQWPDPTLKRSAAVALVRLLPRLQASDRSLLTEGQRQILCGKLRPENIKAHRPLIVAILRAFEQVGDHNCMPAVERLALMETSSRSRRDVREIAVQCREYLEQRADQSRLSQTLLRASDSGVVGQDNLVRPVLELPIAAQEQLLRAGIGPQGSGSAS